MDGGRGGYDDRQEKGNVSRWLFRNGKVIAVFVPLEKEEPLNAPPHNVSPQCGICNRKGVGRGHRCALLEEVEQDSQWERKWFGGSRRVGGLVQVNGFARDRQTAAGVCKVI